MKLNKKGFANVAVIGLVAIIAALVSISVVDTIVFPIGHANQVLNETLTPVYNGSSFTLANPCVIERPTELYDWTNGTAVGTDQYLFEPQEWPHRSAQVITFATGGFVHNDTVIGINYSYGCNYGSGDTFRSVSQQIPLLMALSVLGLAGAYLFMKG